VHQIRDVLRLRPGHEVVLLDNRGWRYEARLLEVRPEVAAGEIMARSPVTSEPHTEVHLFQALLPREKFEWVLQKGTEVGVRHFWPVFTRRALVRKEAISEDRRLARWRSIVREAAEQANRGLLPELHAPLDLGPALAMAQSTDLRLLLWERVRARSLRQVLREATRGRALDQVAIFVGPEGGFEEAEVEKAMAAGAMAVGLGPRILRTETAGPVTTAIVLYELGDMEPVG